MHRCDNLTDWEKDLIVLIAARADMTGERVFLMRKEIGPLFVSSLFSLMNGLIESVARATLKRARRGLFGTTGKLFGNNVSHSERKYLSCGLN